MVFDWLVGSSASVVEITKKVIVAILKWVWEKIKAWIMSHWQLTAIAVLVLLVIGLVKLLLIRISVTPLLKQYGLIDSVSA